MNFTVLYCTLCGQEYAHDVPQNVCRAPSCGKPLFARYDLKAAGRTLTRESLRTREKSLWRYREVLPIESEAEIVSLGEGWTPLLAVSRLGARVGMERLLIKDEAQNPTQSFKARGMAVAVTVAKRLGLKKLA